VDGRGVANVGEERNLRGGCVGLIAGGAFRVPAAKGGLEGKGAPAEGGGMAGAGSGRGD
jgi:hypothetical protein